MTSSDEKKINEYIELIKKHGAKKAAEMLKDSGISFDEDFTETHRTDSIFSSPHVSIKPRPKNYGMVEIFSEVCVGGNIFPYVHSRIGEDSVRLPFSNSNLNLIHCVLMEDDSIVTDANPQYPLLSSDPTFTR